MSSPVFTAELPPARWLYRTRAAAVLWLVVRLALGWGWLSAGWHKITGPDSRAWMDGGTALQGFVKGAIAQSHGKNPDVAYSWYVDFLHWVCANAAPMAKLVAVAEVAVGIMLITGCLTGLAALAGATMNLNYMLAGSAGVNPVFLLAAFLLMLAWRNAGWIGLDRYLLPRLLRRNTHPGDPGPNQPAPVRAKQPAAV